MNAIRRLARRVVPTRGREALRVWRRRAKGQLYRGDRVLCPCCSGRFRDFLPAGAQAKRPGAMCPGCGSVERHRALWLYLERRTDLYQKPHRLLHFAPEAVFAEHFRAQGGIDYVSADLDSAIAMDRVDITRVPYEDDSFDAILCNHVLEHVPEDRQALAELFRVLRPGGWAILQVPVDLSLERTLEDPIDDPAERARLYGQDDHVRRYGADYVDRLREAGFRVTCDPWVSELPPALVEEHRLKTMDVFLCHKPAPSG